MEVRQQTFEDWKSEGTKLFGEKMGHWKFVCPQCGTAQAGTDFKEAGLSEEEIMKKLAFSCIGRHNDKLGCDWTLGGLFKIHTLEITYPDGDTRPMFEFFQEDVRS